MKIKGMSFKQIARHRLQSKKYNCDIFFITHAGGENLQCTIVVRKKLVRSAVKRNQLRRRIRSAIQQNCNSDCKLHLMIILTQPYEAYDFATICSRMRIFFEKMLKYYNERR